MMKYVIIQCAEAHHHELEQIFKEVHINSYCEMPVNGFMKSSDGNSDASNWFGSDKNPYRYVKSCLFLEADKADELLDGIKSFNEKAERISPINAFVMDVEKHV